MIRFKTFIWIIWCRFKLCYWHYRMNFSAFEQFELVCQSFYASFYHERIAFWLRQLSINDLREIIFFMKSKKHFLFEFRNKNLCLLSWMILTLTFTKNITFVASWRFLNLIWFNKFKILNCEVFSNFSMIRKKKVFLILNSYVISLKNSSIATLKELFKLVWINDVALIQFTFEFSVKKNRKAISTIWLIFSNCSSVCEWYTIDISNLIFNLSNRVFQKSEINFESLFDMILSEISQFAISRRWRNASAHSNAI
jgi:hypothetical protein